MSIASKEGREANYWLRLIRDSELSEDEEFEKEVKDTLKESEELKKILMSIVKTAQNK